MLGETVNPASLACNQPTTQYYGIIATPIVDPSTRTLYVESFEQACGNHFVYALSIDDGSTRPGLPVDVGAVVSGFVPGVQHARAGLALLAGNVYVAFSGILFDCEGYSGWVVGISTTDPTKVSVWSTTAPKGASGEASPPTGSTSSSAPATARWASPPGGARRRCSPCRRASPTRGARRASSRLRTGPTSTRTTSTSAAPR